MQYLLKLRQNKTRRPTKARKVTTTYAMSSDLRKSSLIWIGKYLRKTCEPRLQAAEAHVKNSIKFISRTPGGVFGEPDFAPAAHSHLNCSFTKHHAASGDCGE